MRLSFLTTAVVIASALTFFGLHSCSRTVKNEAYYQQISQYVYAFTNGTISRNEPIRVRFVNAAVAPEQIGSTVASGVLSVSPSIEGTQTWEDDRTILIKPEKPLKYGQKYDCTLSIGRIYKEAPATANQFDFSFTIRELNFEVITDGLQTPDLTNMKSQQVAGVVRTNDAVDPAQMESLLSASQNGRALQITWSHTADNTEHRFVVNNVERAMKRSAIDLSWKGAAIGAKEDGSDTIPVPGLDEFEVVSARIENTENQCIIVNFSDPVSAGQYFGGLATVEGFGGDFRFLSDGNFLRIYPQNRISGSRTFTLSGIKNAAGVRLRNDFSQLLNFEEMKPAVRLVGRGAVIPGSQNGSVIFPFEAVGLNAVDVEIFKIYNSNILQYLQVNEIEGENELERVGKIIVQKKIDLGGLRANATPKTWQRYALDLKDLIHQDPAAIYQVRITFRRSYVAYLACGDKTGAGKTETQVGATDEYGNLLSLWGGYRGIYWDDYDNWWYDDDYDYDHREDPCYDEYYNNEQFARRNVFVSDLGLTAKLGKDGSMLGIVTDLNTTAPVGGVDLEFFNYQLQPVAKTTTAADGVAFLERLRDKPFIMVARSGSRRGYLRLADGGTLSLSRFDVAGVETQKGMKGYIYGERGVWRPGDSVFLNFVLEDRTGKLPAGHPVNFELTDSKGALRYRTVVNQGVNGVYPLHFFTNADAPTGNWIARVEVGGAKFSKVLKIETVKPNRLKLNLEFPAKSLTAENSEGNAKLAVQWLHGATARNLKTKVEMQVRTAVTQFPNYKGFVFEDPSRYFHSDEQVLFDGTLDNNGNASIPLNIEANEQAPGKLIAAFKIRAFEEGGDFSTDNVAIDYYPFPRMVGIQAPVNRNGNKSIGIHETGTVEVVCVDNNGKPLSRQKVEVGLYRCDWRWWWDEDRSSNVGQFNSANHINAVQKTTLTTDANGRAFWKISPESWGRYLVRVTDEEGGHAAGDFFWVGYPDRLDDLHSRNAVAMLPLSADKEQYNTGETVTIKLPASENGRVLITLENGFRVVKHLWFDAKAGDNLLTFKAEPDMAPAVYAHVSLLQPHAQTKNDLPIRMYGVVPVNIENPATRLHPDIEMADVLKPGENFTVKLREHGGQACAYTLAIVDEGLLDLTRFQTPNPHDEFYAREALGVKSWDIYDYVLGAYGVELERILSVGGDAFNRKAKNAAQVNRFKPAVIHIGPFYLEKGKTATHQLKIDNYVGSVRVMAVMSAPAPNGKGAYGSAEKTCPVRKPLMILPTLPRVLGPGETVRLPVQVFAMEKKVKSATLRIREAAGKAQITGSPTQTLTFNEPGDQIAWFDLKVGNVTGPAQFTFEAQGGGETATDVIDIMVRNPMPYATSSWNSAIDPGKAWNTPFNADQYADMNSAILEVSALPDINFSRHYDYLIRYPHGCTEQVTSAAFPQLYADIITTLPAKKKEQIQKNVTAAIQKLCNRQDFSGGISYWPGGGPEVWSSTYAGHFLLEAKAKGYAVPESVLTQWVKYQTDMARTWSAGSSRQESYYHDSELTQAYRLYSLAIAGQPALSDMNRLREMKDMYTTSAYLLAAAYAKSGKPEVARELISKPWKDEYQYDWCGYTYGNDLRDRSLILEAYTIIGDMPRAEATMQYIASIMSDPDHYYYYWNTQSLATALRALSQYASKGNIVGPAYTYKIGGGTVKKGDNSRVLSVNDLLAQTTQGGQITVQNTGSVKLYARLVVSGQTLPEVTTSAAPSNLAVTVSYTTPQGAPLNINKIAQGTDFVAVVTVSRNTKYNFAFNELALTQIFPSGWEIANSRMGNFLAQRGGSRFDFQDIRDDRVLTYFDLNGGSDNTRTFQVRLNAAYKGRFFLPGVQCEAMYDSRIAAGQGGMWVEVI